MSFLYLSIVLSEVPISFSSCFCVSLGSVIFLSVKKVSISFLWSWYRNWVYFSNSEAESMLTFEELKKKKFIRRDGIMFANLNTLKFRRNFEYQLKFGRNKQKKVPYNFFRNGFWKTFHEKYKEKFTF